MDAVLDRIEARGEKRGIAIGEKRGENKGVVLSAQVFKAIQSGQRDSQVIAEQRGCTLEQVIRIRKEFEM